MVSSVLLTCSGTLNELFLRPFVQITNSMSKIIMFAQYIGDSRKLLEHSVWLIQYYLFSLVFYTSHKSSTGAVQFFLFIMTIFVQHTKDSKVVLIVHSSLLNSVGIRITFAVFSDEKTFIVCN